MTRKYVLILVLVLFSVGASAMFWPFKKYDVEMSPEVRGVIKFNGESQAGLTVYRELYYKGYKKGKIIKDFIQTDAQGTFSFPNMLIRSRYPSDIFGQNFQINQFIFVGEGKKQRKLWGVSSPTVGLDKLSNMLLSLDCELTNIRRIHEVDTIHEIGFRISVHSICDWKADYISTYICDEKTDTYVPKTEWNN